MIIKPYNTKELAALYGISIPTMKVWLSKIKDLGERHGRIYNIKQVKIIFEHCGMPELKTNNTH